MRSISPITGNATFDSSVKVVSAKFLQENSKVNHFIFAIYRFLVGRHWNHVIPQIFTSRIITGKAAKWWFSSSFILSAFVSWLPYIRKSCSSCLFICLYINISTNLWFYLILFGHLFWCSNCPIFEKGVTFNV